MSEYQVNKRRNWKAQTFPYDHFIPDGTEECQYCLTEKQAEILRGIIEPLGWPTRWWSDTDQEIDPDIIEHFRDDILRRLMMSCCGNEAPPLYRYSGDGILQQSTDGGTTWNDSPQFDTRITSPQFPPMSGVDGEDKKCIAATGAVDLIKQQVGDQLTDGMSRYTLSQLVEDWVTTYIETSNPLLALLTVIANQIFALVIATLRPALTSTVYDQLKCILYCNIASDATFSNASWATVRSDITSQIGGIAGVFLEHLVYLLGEGGLTNLARAGGAVSGSCSSCHCGSYCVDQDFTVNDGDWTNIPRVWGNPAGEWVVGQGWKATYQAYGSQNNELYVASPVLGCDAGTYDFTVTFVVDAYYGEDVNVTFTVGDGGGSTNNNLGITGVGTYVRDYLNWAGVTSLSDISFNCTSNACDYRITAVTMQPSP